MNRILGMAVLSSLVGVTAPRANTQHIPYAGGVQAGTFELRGTTTQGDGLTWNYPDTVLIANNFRIVSFMEQANVRGLGCGCRYWAFLENDSGAVGFQSGGDTLWSNVTAFPNGPVLRDSIYRQRDYIDTNYWYPTNLTRTSYGIQLGVRSTGGEGYPNRYAPSAGSRRVIYFRLNRQTGDLYGKLMIDSQKVDSIPTLLLDGPRVEVRSVSVRYAISDSNHYDPSGIEPARVEASAQLVRKGLVFSQKEGVLWRDGRGKLYNLRGERLRAPAGTP
jgi:hypothetical protein